MQKVKKAILTYSWLLFLPALAFSQNENYWQQEVHYNIRVSLNDSSHTLQGNWQLVYTNHAPDTLTFLWIHLWPNAYQNEQTGFAKQLKSDKADYNKFRKMESGFIDGLAFSTAGKPLVVLPHPQYNDIIKLVLDRPLFPNDSIKLSTPFRVKLPGYFSRSGHEGQQYMVCQWYPKPAVYDRKGWHEMPYLDQGEFYSEYGSFEVSITLPEDYVVAATGTLQTSSEWQKYKAIGSENLRQRENNKQVLYSASQNNKTKTLQYSAENVHDFAWFADKDFIIQYDTLQLPNGVFVDAFTYHQPNGNPFWKNSISFVKDAVRQYSGWLGDYPYPVVQAVEGPANSNSGGMEYPMVTLITSPDADSAGLDAVITHEVGHNWFYGILGTNERTHPWMDEGLNTYYQFRYEALKYRSNSIFGGMLPAEFKKLPVDEFLARIYTILNTNMPSRAPVNTASADFPNKEDYANVVYLKTAIWLFLLERSLGIDVLDTAMKSYFQKWKFKHPYPEDLKHCLEQSSKNGLDAYFNLLEKQGNFK